MSRTSRTTSQFLRGSSMKLKMVTCVGALRKGLECCGWDLNEARDPGTCERRRHYRLFRRGRRYRPFSTNLSFRQGQLKPWWERWDLAVDRVRSSQTRNSNTAGSLPQRLPMLSRSPLLPECLLSPFFVPDCAAPAMRPIPNEQVTAT